MTKVNSPFDYDVIVSGQDSCAIKDLFGSCDGAAARSIRLMFFLEKVGSEPYRIDDVLRFVEEGKWFSLQAWLERRPRP